MQNIKTLAYRFLLEAQIKELNIPIDSLKEILKKQSIYLLKYSELKMIKNTVSEEAYNATKSAMLGNKAISLSTESVAIIMYSDDLSYGEKLQKIFHELGHIKAEHKRSELYTFIPNDEQEREADVFSLYVMAPPCIIKEIGIVSSNDIACLTGLDITYARKAAALIKKDKGNKSLNIERNLLRQFEQFISSNKSNKLNIRKYLIAGAIAITVCCSSFYFHNAYSDTLPDAAATPTYIPAVATQQPSTTPKEEIIIENEIENNTTVWKAKTGDIYHTDPDCYHIPKTAHTMDLEDAISVGYRECKDCQKNND